MKPDTKQELSAAVAILSRLQLCLLNTEMDAEDYNKISSQIGDLKETIINCKTYNQ